MSDIQFVARLGDAFDAAIAAQEPRQARRQPGWRGLVVAAAALTALAFAALAIARVLSSPDELAARSIACYTSADLSSDVTVVANDRAPVAACAEAYRQMGERVPPLIACNHGTSVVVIPGAGASACARAGLAPLPPGFAASQAKVARLAEAVMALEDRQDCVAPAELARGVRRLLDAQGWIGWRAEVRSPLGGPCGTVSNLDGAGRRRIDGALDPSEKIVLVSGVAARSTLALLYGRDGLAPTLEDESGTRCFTISELTTLVQARAESLGRSAGVELAPPLPSSVSIADAREERYRAGCAVLTDVRAARDGLSLVAVIPRPR
jgi:hypothetical protein